MSDTSSVLITGASSGYGLETARYFHEQGWNVIATMRRPQPELLPADRVTVLPRPGRHMLLERFSAPGGTEKVQQHGAKVRRHGALARLGNGLPQKTLGACVVAVGEAHRGLLDRIGKVSRRRGQSGIAHRHVILQSALTRP